MSILRRTALFLLLVALPGCGGIDLGGPGREVPHDTGPLTVPPHMRDGSRQ